MNIFLIAFEKETMVPTLYGIKPRDLVYYTFFAIYIIVYQLGESTTLTLTLTLTLTPGGGEVGAEYGMAQAQANSPNPDANPNPRCGHVPNERSRADSRVEDLRLRKLPKVRGVG